MIEKRNSAFDTITFIPGFPILPIMRITTVAKGRVHGFGYRYFVADCVHKAGVIRVVRNEPDGSVRIVAEGNR
jgi:acylphosphatase